MTSRPARHELDVLSQRFAMAGSTAEWPTADYVLKMAHRVVAEADGEIARLNRELDRYQGRQVLYCTEAAMDAAALDSLDCSDGTILRATDTGKELLMHGGTWAER
jgi:signal transduction histidine kinase